MLADLQAAKRQQQYDSILPEHLVPDLLTGLTVQQYLSRLAAASTSLKTESTPKQPLLRGLQ